MLSYIQTASLVAVFKSKLNEYYMKIGTYNANKITRLIIIY